MRLETNYCTRIAAPTCSGLSCSRGSVLQTAEAKSIASAVKERTINEQSRGLTGADRRTPSKSSLRQKTCWAWLRPQRRRSSYRAATPLRALPLAAAKEPALQADEAVTLFASSQPIGPGFRCNAAAIFVFAIFVWWSVDHVFGQQPVVGPPPVMAAISTARANIAEPELPASAAVAAVAAVKVRNPFDATEVFEFPAGTSKAEDRQKVADLLLQRARDRRRPMDRGQCQAYAGFARGKYVSDAITRRAALRARSCGRVGYRHGAGFSCARIIHVAETERHCATVRTRGLIAQVQLAGSASAHSCAVKGTAGTTPTAGNVPNPEVTASALAGLPSSVVKVTVTAVVDPVSTARAPGLGVPSAVSSVVARNGILSDPLFAWPALF